MPIEAAPAAALWSGLMLILMLALSVLVVRRRREHQVSHGHGDEPKLAAAIRAHGNAAEYIPAAIAALAVLAIAGASPLIVNVVGGVLFLGRAIHAFGLSRTTGVTRARVVGTIFTWTAYVFAIVALLLHAIP
jgi:uncharacterized membrane protein YecN with MAPEG domain